MIVTWSKQAQAQLLEIEDWNLTHHIKSLSAHQIVKITQKLLQSLPGRYSYSNYLHAKRIPLHPYDIGYKIIDDQNVIITKIIRQSSVQ